MAGGPVRSFVFAIDFRVPQPERVWPVLEADRASFVDLGAQYVFAYEAATKPGRVRVVIGVRTDQPLLNLVRFRHFFVWFDAIGIDHIPAVFLGETVERLDISDVSPEGNAGIVVVAIMPVEDIAAFMAHARASVDSFARAGIRKTLVYHGFDKPREVMFLHQLDSEDNARRWAGRSDIAAEWLAAAGVGAYPAGVRWKVRPCHEVGADERDGRSLMYVCLCLGVTNETVGEVAGAGAVTSKQVAEACGAGSRCGRCRRTIRSIIRSFQSATNEPGRGIRV